MAQLSVGLGFPGGAMSFISVDPCARPSTLLPNDVATGGPKPEWVFAVKICQPPPHADE